MKKKNESKPANNSSAKNSRSVNADSKLPQPTKQELEAAEEEYQMMGQIYPITKKDK